MNPTRVLPCSCWWAHEHVSVSVSITCASCHSASFYPRWHASWDNRWHLGKASRAPLHNGPLSPRWHGLSLNRRLDGCHVSPAPCPSSLKQWYGWCREQKAELHSDLLCLLFVLATAFSKAWTIQKFFGYRVRVWEIRADGCRVFWVWMSHFFVQVCCNWV